MRHIKITALALMAAIAACATVASTALATEYHEFVYSKTGRFEGRALDTQNFRMPFNGDVAKVECTEARPSGELTTLKFRELPLSVNYSGCALDGVGPATVSTARYTWSLPLSVQFENALTLYASDSGIVCKYTITGDQSLGGNEGEVEYQNNPKTITINDKLQKVAYEIVESNSEQLCGQAGEKGTGGTIKGEIEVELLGGTIQVM